jgi:MHS family proline/betaine transporter-like MFS transporter
MILVAAANTAGYALTSYMPTYLTDSKGYDPVHGTLLTIPVLVVMSLCIPLTGKLSDRIGRRPVLWIGAVSTVVLRPGIHADRHRQISGPPWPACR